MRYYYDKKGPAEKSENGPISLEYSNDISKLISIKRVYLDHILKKMN